MDDASDTIEETNIDKMEKTFRGSINISLKFYTIILK